MGNPVQKFLSVSNKLLKRYLPETVHQKLEYYVTFILNSEFRINCIRYKKYGKLNKDKIFYVLRADAPRWGILTTYIWFIKSMEWAIHQGYIPVVDLKNYYMDMVQDEEKMYKENAWDYYFVQPFPEYTLESVYKSRHVILGWKNGTFPHDKDWTHDLPTDEEMRSLHPVVKNYMNFKPQIWERAKNFLQDNVRDGKKVLAICMRASFLRGELLKQSLYKDHPKQKSLHEWLEIVSQLKDEWDCDYVFVSVEDREWSDAFRDRFGEQCLILERQLLHFFRNGEPVPNEETEYFVQELKNISIKKKTEDYLTEVCIVSMCSCLTAQSGSVPMIAMLHNGGKYEHTRVFSDGFIQ